MATYNTEIQWGGPDAEWRRDKDLEIALPSRDDREGPADRPETGTGMTWYGEQGNAAITFFDNGSRFQGTAQFPGEGPVGYRGTLSD